jgi:phage/plasmid-like protein (TIGR03299 family)
MPDMVEHFAGAGAIPWWAGTSPTMKSMTILDENKTGHEMLVAASLDGTVSKRPLFYGPNPDLADTGMVKVPGMVATVRDDDNQFLGLVSPSYQIVQNELMAEMADILIGEGAKCHTVGSLYAGKIVWLLAVLDRELFINGDPSKYASYLLLTQGHDGKHPVTFANTPTRVVCANTMHAALEGAKAKISLRHTANIASRLDEVRKALGMANQYIDRFEAVANQLTTIPTTLKDIEAFTVKLIPTDPNSEHPYKTEAQRQEIAELFAGSKTLVDVPFPAYRAFQAVSEWTDHVATVRDTKTAHSADRRAMSIIEGPAYAMKSAALKLLVP